MLLALRKTIDRVAKRPVARWVRGTKNRNYRNLKRSRQMHGTSIAADQKARAPRQRNQFGN